jgi:hypothetical protein
MQKRLVVVLTLVLVVLSSAVASAQDRKDSGVLWKAHCPVNHEVRVLPAGDWGGFHVVCQAL